MDMHAIIKCSREQQPSCQPVCKADVATAGGNSDGGLLLPVAAFMRSNSSGLLGSPSGWETPLGMGGHDPQVRALLLPPLLHLKAPACI
jgi:hypothetical protein